MLPRGCCGDAVTIDVVWGGARYICAPADAPAPDAWAFPVGDATYPPERWYCATWHDLTGALNGGYRHTGLDINLDVAPWGDIERMLGLQVYALAHGVVTYSGEWSGNGVCVIEHLHNGAPLWVRYAHIVPTVRAGDMVQPGQTLGPFDNWRTGDHLHLDMALDRFAREWLATGIRWVDPIPVLKAHLDPVRVDAMLRRGG